MPQPPRLDLPERMRFSAFGRLYLLLAAVVAIALLYLIQAAGGLADGDTLDGKAGSTRTSSHGIRYRTTGGTDIVRTPQRRYSVRFT